MQAERWRLLLVLLLFALLPALAQAQDAAAVERRVEALDRQLLSDTTARIEGSDNGFAHDLLARARRLREEALRALGEGDAVLAEQQIGLALSSYYAANRELHSGGATSAALEKRNIELREEIDGYYAAFMAGLEEKGPGYADLLDRTRFNDLLAAARMYANVGDHSAAQQGLTMAHEMVVSAITRLRRNDTLVHALDFRTPADEYRYEVDRHRGYELLVQQVRAGGGPEGAQAALVQRFLGEARRLTSQAEAEAARGEHQQAIRTMEEANQNMLRSLQMMGVGISG